MDPSELYHSIRPRYPEFTGQVALVTGSARGIGRGIAFRLAREGMKVVIHSNVSEQVEATARELRELGADVLPVTADISTNQGIDHLFEQTLKAYGTLDLLVNDAADMRRVDLLEMSEELLDYQVSVNIRATYLCAIRAARILSEKRRGNIVNISSVGGLRAHWRGHPYDMTKGAIDGMTRAMSLDLGQLGVRVNAIAPGAIRVERTPAPDATQVQAVAGRITMGRYGTPLEIGSVVAFLHSDDAAYITGQVIYVDGGITTQLSPPGQPI